MLKVTLLCTLTVAVLLLFVLSVCGGGSNTSSSPSNTPLAVSATAPDGLTMTLAETTANVAIGGSVTYTFTLANQTTQPITFLSSAPCGIPAFSAGNGELTIVNVSRAEVYPDGGGCSAVGPIESTMLLPGQSLSGTLTPAVYAASGRYSATVAFDGVTLGPLGTTAR